MQNTEENPIISVVIPEYSGKGKIERCLKCLDAQSFDAFEVLIVDDYSPDDSVTVIKEFINSLNRFEKFRLIESKENGRAGKARNIGIKEAKGSYICFIDQDDYPATNMLECLYSNSQNGTIDCVSCDVEDKLGKLYRRPKIYENKSILEEKAKFIQTFGYVFGMIIKRDVIINNNLYFPEKLMYEDTLYNCGLFASVKSMVTISNPLYIRNVDNDSQTAFLNQKKISDRINSTKWYLESFKNNENTYDYVEIINTVAAYYIVASCLWWMMCDKSIYTEELYLSCITWADENDINWKMLQNDAALRNFGIIKVILVRMVYKNRLLFNLLSIVLRNYRRIRGKK